MTVRVRAGLLAAVMGCVLALGVWADDASPKPEKRLVRLRYTPALGSFVPLASDPLADREVVFKEVPDLQGKAMCGAIPLGLDGFVGYAYVPARRTLYVDSNRNLDLSDDRAEYTCSFWSSHFCKFSGVRLQLPEEAGHVRYRVDLEFRGDDRSIRVTSGWSARIKLNGRPWHLTVVDNLDGVIDWQDAIILRTGKEQSQWAETGFVDPYGTSVPNRLYLDGRTYDLEFAFKEGDLLVSFVECTPELGELHIPGESMARMVLEDPSQGLGAILYSPEPTLRLPTGTYNARQVFLEDGSYSATSTILTAGVDPVLENAALVSKDAPATLAAGGPLTPKVAVEGHGVTLRLDFALHGAGGERYQHDEPWTRPRPEFAVFKGDEVVHVGRFRYG